MIHLRNCKFVITWRNDELVVLEDIDIKIRDSIIEEAGKNLPIESGYEIINASNYIVMPGLVNAHTHSPMILLRGYYDDAELHVWLEKMWSIEKKLTPEITRLASEMAILEMIISGTVMFIDMYFYPEVTAEVANQYGIRACLGPVFLDTISKPEQVVNELRNLYFKYRDHELIKPIVNIHSIYACSRETIEIARDVANELNLHVHIHVSETRDEIFKCKKMYGKFPVEYLDSLGLVNNNVQMVHLGWVTNWEIEIIKKKNAKVTHCPTSNMKLATAGFFPFRELVESDVVVTIGTDGAASNNSLDMFREMKNTVLLQRNNYWEVKIKAHHVLKAATINGYRLIGLKGGNIEKNYKADLVMIRIDNPHIQPLRKDNLISNIVYTATGRDVDTVIISGKIVYQKEKDYEKVREKILEISQKLNQFITQNQ